jgi:SecD/SecF fusion protein
MRNKTGIIILTIIVTALCLYQLLFTMVARDVQKDATEFATNDQGQIDNSKKQKYLDSIYPEPVFNLLGMEYTYREIKENELSLGLDLQGGMHVVLEVSPVEILKALAGNNGSDPHFTNALNMAKELQRNNQGNFTDLFYEAYEQINPGRPLSAVFNNTLTRDKGITNLSTDTDIKRMINTEVGAAIDLAEQIIRTRIDKFGVIQPNIQRLKGTGRIQLELPGVDNPQRVRNLLQGVAQLEFLEVQFINEVGPSLTKINDYLLSIEKTKADTAELKVDKKTSDDLFEDDTTATGDAATVQKDTAKADTTASQVSSFFQLEKSKSGYSLYFDVKDTAKINQILAMPKVKALIPSTTRFVWEYKRQDKNKDDEALTIELLPVKKARGRGLTGEVVVDASVDNQMGEVQVTMKMNEEGARKWKTMTREASQPNPAGKRRIAIVLDNSVRSAPVVNEEIPNGTSSISGSFSLEEANDLANVLKAGKLPAPVRIVEEVNIGPTIGKEAIAQGLNSMIAGLILVVIFMVFYYSKGGFVADTALLFNILFILGIMASFNSVLTLPGIAGIVLTIGMAVDANVLIFERIREELRLGKPLLTAIDLGYDKAFSSIFDSNLTTIISAVILAWLGSGPVQGFAVTLIIGIFCSFFTSVYISKLIILWITKNKDPKSITFSTVLSRNLFRNLNFDIIGKRKIAYVFSSVVITIGIVSIFMQGGLNLGVDFKGGRSYIVQFNEPVVASELREKLSDDFKNAGTEVKAYGSNSKMKITTSYLTEDESGEADKVVESALLTGLKDFRGNKFEVQQTNKVGATVADDIVWDSYKAIFFSLIGIFLYVFIRFKKLQFSIGGIVALVHDTLVVLGMFSILRLFGIAYEIDQIFVAAILTIVGFSINDTVIVFDRVREFIADNPRLNLPTVINKAINDTLSRTIITTLTVLFVVAILFIFGGETLRGFSLALLIGIVFGSYSTIFIAVPMVLDLRSKKDKDTTTPIAASPKRV